MMQEQPEKPRFVVGIDLGTTNSAVGFVDTRSGDRRVHVFPIVQFVAAAETEARETLPSFQYSPAPGEFASFRLPWSDTEPECAVGVFARDHGAAVPGRLSVSAKSWLCHSGVDRTANLLPWHGAPDVAKLSPTEVSSRYLRHIRDAWNHRWPDFPLEGQEVIVTIPASFDEIARELTVKAAQLAGLRRIVLLEEPQAAFYAWINAHGSDWQRHVQPGQVILVCDVGGGTTDLTLIEVRPGEGGEVKFHRFAVGEHLILGGDNLDLALAHFIEQRLAPGGKLEPRQWSVLVRRCQQAKEVLLGRNAPDRFTVNLPSAGARLIGGSVNVEIGREEVLALLVDGFMPEVGLREKPARRASGFQEFGLPYAPDPGITRYVAAFLSAHGATLAAVQPGADARARVAETEARPARPDLVLLNGGLFESPMMQERFMNVLGSWFTSGAAGPWRPVLLANERLDLAVAMGAAYYGMVRRGLGVRISGGLARSYYVGVSQGGKVAAVCLVPAGLEEGQEAHLGERRFELLIRQPVEFPLFVSSSRTTDRPGDLVEVDLAQLSPLPPIRTVLRSGKGAVAAERISVQLHARLTEIGTLEVWCAEADSPRKWKLDFDVRAATQTDVQGHSGAGETGGFLDLTTVERCCELIRAAFGPGSSEAQAQGLVKRMEEVSGIVRFEWPPTVLRTFWETLLSCEESRRMSVAHEARWLNLFGFSMRPGYGVAVDDWRVAQTWRVFEKKVAHGNNEMCRAEWWILWRRIAGGLVSGQQRVLADPLIGAIRTRARHEKSGAAGKSKGPAVAAFRFGPQETQEVWRLLGSIELISIELKTELGDHLVEQIERKGPGLWEGAALWALGRLGARIPAYGPVNLVAPIERVEAWLDRLLALTPADEALSFPLFQLARRTGDRYRDLGDSVRARVLSKLNSLRAPRHYVELVEAVGELQRDEQNLVFGESLPPGLALA